MPNQIPFDGEIEAQYADGYIHSETDLRDVSPYEQDRNVFYDVLNRLPEADHGPMIRFSVYYQNHRYDIDWRDMPDTARPVRYKNMEADSVGSQITDVRLMAVGFGWQYTDDTGRNVQHVQEL